MNQRLINYFAFSVLGLLWVSFSAALLFNQEILHAAWELLLGWPWVLKGIVTLAILPVVLGLWVWHSILPLWLRLILVIGLAWFTLNLFFPGKTPNQAKTSSVNS